MIRNHIEKYRSYVRISVITLIIVMLFSGFTFAAELPAESSKPDTRVFSHTITNEDIIKYGTYKGRNATRIPIITYHQIVKDNEKRSSAFRNNKWCISESTFKQHMRYLYNMHYRTINCDEFYLWYIGKIKLPPRSVLITFDDGNNSAIRRAFPVLQRLNMKGTCFIIGSLAHAGGSKRYLSEKNLLKLHNAYPNIEFQSHTYNLHYFAAYDKSYRVFLNDAITMNNLYGFNYLAYPYGAKNIRMITAFKNKNTGIRMAFSFNENGYATRKQNYFNIKRFGITHRTTYKEFRRWCP